MILLMLLQNQVHLNSLDRILVSIRQTISQLLQAFFCFLKIKIKFQNKEKPIINYLVPLLFVHIEELSTVMRKMKTTA